MREQDAITALAGLAHIHRLRAFRLLVRAGRGGVAAGELATRLGVSPSALTFHLKELEASRLVSQRRMGRNLLYAANIDLVQRLSAFLGENCCAGLAPLELTPPGTEDEGVEDAS